MRWDGQEKKMYNGWELERKKKKKHPPLPPKNENSQNKSKLRASDRAIGGDLALNKQRVLIAGSSFVLLTSFFSLSALGPIHLFL
jgi:hypothetical protein